ncbi:hypothetical protein [Micromonospora narathiwatensis]|uniref:Uncharacterized protein n=1 Tax=Micromonospora narathiwatensis TaxID=299146 RepID=A0A1A8Z5F2_9ACTN|nr:hypothetical protein [Micromonospora narathiwatensis]SBT39035.1 hypothetical protein GA0070621_0565 [Micromonospora narathiwatensis]
MAIWSELRDIMRWLLRRPDSPPPPGTGQCHQAAEQAAAKRRLLDQAKQLGDTQRRRKPTQAGPYVPTALDQRTGDGTRGHR